MSGDGILNEPVLILNANFEPIHICDTKRALALVLTGKAEIILNGRGIIRSSSNEYEVPSVVRLSHMIKRPRPRISLSKREILRRDDYTCQYCGRKMRYLTIDHVIPRWRGGPHTWKNLVAACATCNRKKGGKSTQAAGMQLNREPFEPRPTATYRFGQHLQHYSEWRQFVEGW